MASSHSNDDVLSAAELARIDQLCDEFETEWQRLDRPKIEEYLDGSELRLRSQLLEELVKIDQHWRIQESNPDVFRKEYARRFPGDIDTLKQIIGTDTAGEHPALLPNHTTLGPFVNLQRIGEGGFGVVFRAWDSRHQRDVALKIPRFGHELTAKDLGRFLREAKAAGSLDHTGIARVWDSGTISGITYIAYQFIEGANLKVRFDEISSRSPTDIVAMVRRLAEAVHFAHEHGIVHRDIKPSNILLTTDDRPVLTDFGLALATGKDATRSLAARVGTLDYMSPEQAAGTSPRVDGRTDLWSLGVLTYELMTGRRPFQGSSDVEVLRAIQQDEPKRLRSLDKKIPLDLDVLVMRCLQKRPRNRLASCGFLAEELERIERGEPIRSRPVSFVERSLRWCRRNTRAVTTFGLILLATVFGTWSWSGWLVANQQNENAVQELQIKIEAGKVRRRELIGEFLLRDTAALHLEEDDLQYVETRFLATENRVVRYEAARLLARHGCLSRQRFPKSSEKSEKCVELLQRILKDESIDDATRQELADSLEEIGGGS